VGVVARTLECARQTAGIPKMVAGLSGRDADDLRVQLKGIAGSR
jgi:hypothetical protein